MLNDFSKFFDNFINDEFAPRRIQKGGHNEMPEEGSTVRPAHLKPPANPEEIAQIIRDKVVHQLGLYTMTEADRNAYVMVQALKNRDIITVVLAEDLKEVIFVNVHDDINITMWMVACKCKPDKKYHIHRGVLNIDENGEYIYNIVAKDVSVHPPTTNRETGELSLYDLEMTLTTPVEHLTFTATLNDKYTGDLGIKE